MEVTSTPPQKNLRFWLYSKSGLKNTSILQDDGIGSWMNSTEDDMDMGFMLQINDM